MSPNRSANGRRAVAYGWRAACSLPGGRGTGYGYPDHDVHVRDVDAWVKGTALVVLPKAGGKGTATITVQQATIDLTAGAEGWFWTVNISGEVKKQIDSSLVRDVVGKAIKLAFDAKL